MCGFLEMICFHRSSRRATVRNGARNCNQKAKNLSSFTRRFIRHTLARKKNWKLHLEVRKGPAYFGLFLGPTAPKITFIYKMYPTKSQMYRTAPIRSALQSPDLDAFSEGSRVQIRCFRNDLITFEIKGPQMIKYFLATFCQVISNLVVICPLQIPPDQLDTIVIQILTNRWIRQAWYFSAHFELALYETSGRVWATIFLAIKRQM